MGEAFIARRGGGKVGLKSISVTTPPNKTTYVAGETFDATGMVVMADLGGIQIEASGYTVNPIVMTAGVTSVTISYEFASVTKTTEQAVTVKTLSSIAITSQPTKRAYNYGETFNPAGMVITATYSDGSTAVVTGWTYSPTGALNHSSTTVTVSYSAGGTTKTATTTITVAKILSSIVITTAPTKTSYISGQTFSSAGMVVRATYSDNSTATVTSSCSFTPTTMVSGTTSVTVSYTYEGITKTASQQVSVTTPSSTLNSNSWATIAMVSAAGTADNFWNLGDEKTETLNGVTHTFQIIGFNHDSIASNDAKYGDSSYNGGTNKAGITFQMKEELPTSYYMNGSQTNVGGWDTCYMRGTVMPMLKGYMPSAMQGVLRNVSKLTSAGNTSANIVTSIDQVFLLAEIEVFGSTTYAVAGEGSQYAYYAAGNTKVKTQNGSAYRWWLRSPVSSSYANFVDVYADGTVNYNGASYARGVAAGFCV